MVAVDQISVAILYRHQLFGEGIAHFLAGEPDVAVESIPIGAGHASAGALRPGSRPDVVIFERSDPDAAVELLREFPDALVIDVAQDAGPTFAFRREVIGSRPEAIVRAIRDFARNREATGGLPRPGRRTPATCLVIAGRG